jgi:hypothetical protein
LFDSTLTCSRASGLGWYEMRLLNVVPPGREYLPHLKQLDGRSLQRKLAKAHYSPTNTLMTSPLEMPTS